MRYRAILLALLLLGPAGSSAQTPSPQLDAQQLFEAMPNGGIIELQRAPDDSAGMRTVRMRLRALAQALSQGDVTSPAAGHLTSAPGARTMIERRNAIRYDYRELPRGAALRITTADVVARKAVWEFIAFARNEQLANP